MQYATVSFYTNVASGPFKLKRDMLIYLMWQSGQLTNLQIAEKFGLSYSAVSQRVGVFKDLLGENTTLQNKFN